MKAAVAPDGTAFDLIGDESRPLIALIHGLGLSRRIWDDHIPLLSKYYRILNYDLYGHGDSTPAPSEASLRVYANQLADLLDHLDISQANIIGFSIGGMINRRFAIDYPARLSSLVILNSPHDRGKKGQQLVEDRAAKVRDQGVLSTLDDALKRWFTEDYLANGEGVKLVRVCRERVDPESYAQAAWVLANGVRELIRPNPPISAPSLVITCEKDTGSTPEMSKEIAAEIEHSETVIIPFLQHLGVMEKPDLFTKPILEFLERTLR